MQYGALYKMTGLAANNGYLINKEHNNENMYSDLIRVIIENTPEFDLYTVFPLLNLITSLNFSYLIAKNQYAICEDMEYLGYYRKMTDEESEAYSKKPTTFNALSLAFDKKKEEYKEIPVEKSLVVINESKELKRIKELKSQYLSLKQDIEDNFNEVEENQKEYTRKLKQREISIFLWRKSVFILIADYYNRGISSRREKKINELKKYIERLLEDINHIDENGCEFWYASELQKVLDYKKCERFSNVIKNAMIVCKQSGYNVLE